MFPGRPDLKARRPNSAAAWDARLRSGDVTAADLRDAKTWRERAPANAADLDDLHAKIGLLKEAYSGEPRLRRLTVAGRRKGRRALDPPSQALIAASVVISILPLVALRWSAGQDMQADVYRSGAGEAPSAVLADGSIVTLNSRSVISVRYTGRERSVRIQKGEVFFRVTKDSRRAFKVAAGEYLVVAVGTAFFNVRYDGPIVTVSMIEGHVRVAGPNWGDPQDLFGGERMIIGPNDRRVIEDADLARDLAWRDGRITFDNVSVGEAVRKSNRYRPKPILLHGGMPPALRVNGMFRTPEPMPSSRPCGTTMASARLGRVTARRS